MKLLNASIREITEAYQDAEAGGNHELARFWRLTLTERLLTLVDTVGIEQTASGNDTGEFPRRERDF